MDLPLPVWAKQQLGTGKKGAFHLPILGTIRIEQSEPKSASHWEVWLLTIAIVVVVVALMAWWFLFKACRARAAPVISKTTDAGDVEDPGSATQRGQEVR